MAMYRIEHLKGFGKQEDRFRINLLDEATGVPVGHPLVVGESLLRSGAFEVIVNQDGAFEIRKSTADPKPAPSGVIRLDESLLRQAA